MGRINDVRETVNQAIRFAQSHPCAICRYETATHYCNQGVKYKGTCEVYMKLKRELLKMREVDEK